VGNLAELIVQHGVPVVALLILLGQLGLPTGVSAEVMLLLTGCYAVHSFGELVGAVVVIAAADLAGAAVLFAAARRGGTWLATRRRTISPERPRRNPTLLLLCRCLPLVRMPATIAAGLIHMPTRRFLAGSSLAGLVWCGVPLGAGYLMRTDVRAVADEFGAASQAMLWVLPAAGAAVALARWAFRRSDMPKPPIFVPARLAVAPVRGAMSYRFDPIVTGSSGWLPGPFHEPVTRRTFG
jgi:membrane protein DedA with SNARE-associated domain